MHIDRMRPSECVNILASQNVAVLSFWDFTSDVTAHMKDFKKLRANFRYKGSVFTILFS